MSQPTVRPRGTRCRPLGNGSLRLRESVPSKAREIKPSTSEIAWVRPASLPAFVFPLDSRLQIAGYSAPVPGAGKPRALAPRDRAGGPAPGGLAAQRQGAIVLRLS